MEPKNNLTELKEKVLEMSRYYYKGFGNIFQGILINAEAYIIEPKRQEWADNSYKWLKEIEDFYQGIPFDQLHGKEEFYPLFIMKRLLPKVKEQMNYIFKENEENIRNLNISTGTIVDVSRLYWDDFTGLMKKIRGFPEAKDFRIKIVDYKGDVWHF